jgi:hypothetical protein
MFSTRLEEEGVAMTESVIPEQREDMLVLPADFVRFSEAMDCLEVRMGLEGEGKMGCGVDIQSEAAAGRRLERSSLGVRLGGGEEAREEVLEASEDEVPSDEPRGMFEAHTRILRGSLPGHCPLGMS